MPETMAWNLVADIGGTNARFALHDINNDVVREITVLSVMEYPAFIDALDYFINRIDQSGGWCSMPQAACLAVACPVDQELISFTNSNWRFSRAELAKALNHIRVDVINDFTAIGYCIQDLRTEEWHQIGGGQPQAGKPVAILGPGTGLGVCTMVPADTGFVVVDGEGGHIDFAPVNVREISILSELQSRYQHVSVERLLSGGGIVNIYQALCQLDSAPPIHHTAQQITQAALDATDELSIEALSIFCRVLGSTASNLALICGAKGGVYIAGGIVPRFLDFIDNSEFRQRFEDKGRFKSYVESIPVRVLLKDQPGLHGAVQRLKTHTSRQSLNTVS